jgi:hypothetical protein
MKDSDHLHHLRLLIALCAFSWKRSGRTSILFWLLNLLVPTPTNKDNNLDKPIHNKTIKMTESSANDGEVGGINGDVGCKVYKPIKVSRPPFPKPKLYI